MFHTRNLLHTPTKTAKLLENVAHITQNLNITKFTQEKNPSISRANPVHCIIIINHKQLLNLILYLKHKTILNKDHFELYIKIVIK